MELNLFFYNRPANEIRIERGLLLIMNAKCDVRLIGHVHPFIIHNSVFTFRIVCPVHVSLVGRGRDGLLLRCGINASWRTRPSFFAVLGGNFREEGQWIRELTEEDEAPLRDYSLSRQPLLIFSVLHEVSFDWCLAVAWSAALCSSPASAQFPSHIPSVFA